jgi:hypothetical protein
VEDAQHTLQAPQPQPLQSPEQEQEEQSLLIVSSKYVICKLSP